MSNFFLFQFIVGDYPIFANAYQTKRGSTAITYMGYTYGKKAERKYGDKVVWVCTKTWFSNKSKRCPGTVVTRTIDGYLKMRINNPNHLCCKNK